MPGSPAVRPGSQQAQAGSSTSRSLAAWPACRSGQSLGSRNPGCFLQTFPGPKVGGPTEMLRGMYLTRNGNLQRRHTMKE